MRFLIAIDKSDPAKWALELGAKMAQEMCATLVLMTVVPLNVFAWVVEGMLELMDPQHHQEGKDLLEKLRQTLPPSVKSAQIVREGTPAEEIITAAKALQADFIVIGTRGRSRVTQFFLGSTAEAVVRRASCPVITVRQRVTWATEQKDMSERSSTVANVRPIDSAVLQSVRSHSC
jgi:nucleotide-binding universal stress UspA family protein